MPQPRGEEACKLHRSPSSNLRRSAAVCPLWPCRSGGGSDEGRPAHRLKSWRNFPTAEFLWTQMWHSFFRTGKSSTSYRGKQTKPTRPHWRSLNLPLGTTGQRGRCKHWQEEQQKPWQTRRSAGWEWCAASGPWTRPKLPEETNTSPSSKRTTPWS